MNKKYDETENEIIENKTFDMTRPNSLFYMYSGHEKRVVLDKFDSLHGGRWLNGINSIYPRVPPLDLRSSLRGSFPGGG